MARKTGAVTRVAAPTTPAPDGPHWQVARLAAPGQVFTATSTRGVVTTVTADDWGVVFPHSIDELRLIDHLPVATPERIAAAAFAPAPEPEPAGDADPSTDDPTDDAGADADEED